MIRIWKLLAASAGAAAAWFGGPPMLRELDFFRVRRIEVYGAEQADPPRFFKFRDPDGVEVDVATPERGWKF